MTDRPILAFFVATLLGLIIAREYRSFVQEEFIRSEAKANADSLRKTLEWIRGIDQGVVVSANELDGKRRKR